MDPSLILKELQAVNNDRVASKPAAREAMICTAQKLVASLLTPSELIASVGWAEPNKAACMRIAIDLDIFNTLNDFGDEGASAADLAKPKGADVSLVTRIMKHLAATWVVAEIGPDRFQNTSVSKQLVEQQYRDGVLTTYDTCAPSALKLPAYLRQTSWRNPQDSFDGPFQYAFETKSGYFQWLADNPPYQAVFASYMGGRRSGRKIWSSHDFFPVQSHLIDPHRSDYNETVLVHVGGGLGHDLLHLLAAFPMLAGKLILQDQAAVVASHDPPLPSSIKAMAHDFFTPQTVKHARAYFLHSVIHDWPDEDCVKILKALIPAMKPGYSKVLVNDLLIADQEASWFVTSMDLLMSNAVAGRERTESDFRKIFEAAGLQIDKIWIYEPATEVVIEASLPA